VHETLIADCQRQSPAQSTENPDGPGLLPICVDLDGTLIRSDLLFESLLQLIRQRPLFIFLLPLWLYRGKAYLKAAIARHVSLDLDSIPVNEALLEYLRHQRQLGHKLYLFTAADASFAHDIAGRFGIFEAVHASDGTTNLYGMRKLASIKRHVGNDFIYAGDSEVDLCIWREAKGAIVAGSGDLVRKAGRLTTVEASFPHLDGTIRTWGRAMRIHQWSKNLLVMVPFLLAGPLADPADLPNVLLGALLISLLASGTYIINDLLDIQADRLHRSKRHRPFASGALPIKSGLIAVPILGLAVILLGSVLPVRFLQVAAAYLAVSLTYSFALKRVPILDVIVLGSLFTARILAGALLIAQPTSYWLMIFSMCLFFSLALVKRYSELLVAQAEVGAGGSARGYVVQDLPLLLTLGVSGGIAAIVILVLFLADSHFARAIYWNAEWLWPVCIAILYWITRVWLLTTRGEMHDDPIVFALKDKVSLALGVLVVLSLVLAW
jgi:4-hydroxybenzoate polyprenyltransferase